MPDEAENVEKGIRDIGENIRFRYYKHARGLNDSQDDHATLEDDLFVQHITLRNTNNRREN